MTPPPDAPEIARMCADKTNSAQNANLSDDLAQAYRDRAGRLRAIAAKAGREDAADLVQDAFLRTVESGREAEVKAPVHLLFRILRNAVIDRLRSRSRADALFRADGTGPDAADPTANPERALIASQRLKRALSVIDSMPAKRREVFLLHRLEGLSYPQIAARAGISIKTVEKHMGAAMAHLSREMEGEPPAQTSLAVKVDPKP